MDPEKINQPRIPKAKVCIWADLTVNHLDMMADCKTSHQLKTFLSKVLSLDDDDNIRHCILLDLYYYVIRFARDNKFSKEQTSAFFSIVKKTHDLAVETPFENVQECFSYFKELLLCHAVFRPPFSLGLYTPEEIRSISTYVVDTYFRHYKMYKYAFTPQVRLDLSINYDGMPETPPPELNEEDETVGDVDHSLIEQDEDQEGRVSGTDLSPIPDENNTKPEESEAAKQLREMVRAHLATELKKLKLGLDETLKTAEDSVSQRISSAEAVSTGPGAGTKKGAGDKKKK